jgi:hypothetical protein
MCVANIDILINQDWSAAIQKFEYLKNLIIDHPEIQGKRVGDYMVLYNFAAAGAIGFFSNLTTKKYSAASWSGKMVENILPWTSQLRKDLQGLNLAAIGLQSNFENLSAHNDSEEKHCKINYMLDDYSDITYVKNRGHLESYPSKKNTAWLIDTTKTHWVSNNTSTRYVFQLTFHQDFSEVKNWFDNRGSLIY